MARVFILEKPTVNVTKAKHFGQICILLGKEKTRISALNCDDYAGLVIEKLEEAEFDPDQDMIGIVGASSSLVVALTAIVTRWKSGIRCLMFNANLNRYVVRTLGRWAYSTEKWEKG